MLTPNLRAVPLALAFVVATSAGCGGPPPNEKLGSAEAALSRFPAVAEKDLAVVFALDSSAPIRASDATRAGALLPRTWYGAVSNAFRATDVGDALDTESAYGDWQIISMRIAPCSALGSAPSANVDHLCWPELRIVWQPVVHDVFIHQRFATSFADDRAMHALYDVPAEVGLGSADAARARALVQQIKAFDATWHGGPYAPLAPRELAEFVSPTSSRIWLAPRVSKLSRLSRYPRAGNQPSSTPGYFSRSEASPDRSRRRIFALSLGSTVGRS